MSQGYECSICGESLANGGDHAESCPRWRGRKHIKAPCGKLTREKDSEPDVEIEIEISESELETESEQESEEESNTETDSGTDWFDGSLDKEDDSGGNTGDDETSGINASLVDGDEDSSGSAVSYWDGGESSTGDNWRDSGGGTESGPEFDR